MLVYIATHIPSLRDGGETVRLSHFYQHSVPNGTIFSTAIPRPIRDGMLVEMGLPHHHPPSR
ncbi:MAG: hypothetical protein LBF67_03145 [Prevotellaceae bacterium]|nr:hypothetical protein [Prevotellaceae bacterium]